MTCFSRNRNRETNKDQAVLYTADCSTFTGRAACCFVALLLITSVTTSGGNGQSLAPRFEDYPVPNTYPGVARSPDFGSRERFEGTDLRCFGLDRAFYAGKEVNFAGHFVINACTCGSGCSYLYMWDAVSGKFYPRLPPGAFDVGPYERRGVPPPGIVYKGEKYRVNSSLLIVEGCVEDTCDCATRYYSWTASRFNLILRQPVRMPERCLKKQ
jgi:hypothetical protein